MRFPELHIADSVVNRIMGAAKTITGLTPPKIEQPKIEEVSQRDVALMQTLDDLTSAVGGMKESMSAEKELVRDEQGNVTGSRVRMDESGMDLPTILQGGSPLDALTK